jgi:hypothetical protein
MPEIYRTRARDAGSERGVLVIHCSDPRYQPHFQDFLRTGLGLERYGLIAVPGGPQFLTPSDYLPKFSWAGWRWMKFMTNLIEPERIILLAHDDCRWYLDQRFWGEPATLRARQVADLQRVRTELVERSAKGRVELYYARLVGGSAAFESL